MKKYLLLAALLAFTSVSFIAGPRAQADAKKSTVENDGFKLIHVADLEKMLKAHKKIYVFDANTDKTRTESGLIPGAVPMDSVAQYDASQVLPPEKNAKLIFYCHGTECMASHEAANIAVKAGYKNVSVMADGIVGWVAAGQPVDKYVKK